MLFLLELLADEYDAHFVEVDAEGDHGMLLYAVPGILHLAAPVDVVENEDGVVVRLLQGGFEIAQGRLVHVVAIDEHESERTGLLQHILQHKVEVADKGPYVAQLQLIEGALGNAGYVGTAFYSENLPSRMSRTNICSSNTK